MMQLACPFCGPRSLEEFSFARTCCESSVSVPTDLYELDGSADTSLEHWQHVGGCRAWLAVRRNPSTGEILRIDMLGVRNP